MGARRLGVIYKGNEVNEGDRSSRAKAKGAKCHCEKEAGRRLRPRSAGETKEGGVYVVHWSRYTVTTTDNIG